MSENEVYLTPKELTKRYRGLISIRTLANWRSAGGGPGYTKIGGRVLYPISLLLKWETRRKIIRKFIAGLWISELASLSILAAPFY